jgi:hypothetical protein
VPESEKENSPDFNADAGTSSVGFSSAELIACEACQRLNPPTRNNCIYCGAGLPVTAINEKPEGINEKPEVCLPALPQAVTESGGYYLVLAPNQQPAESSLTEIASLLHVKTSEAESAFKAGGPAPLARASSAEEAAMLADKFRALGIEVLTVADEALHAEMPKKIRSLEFSDDILVGSAVSGGGRFSALWDDVILIVTGRLTTSRMVVEERQRRGRSKPIDSRELFSDEAIIDLYSRSNEASWRISASGFDFSCLGSVKAMTTFENLRSLINLLRERAKNVEVDESFSRLRPLLANVWPVEPQISRGEWRRSGAGGVNVSTITTTDNEPQFTSYSRLRHWLKLRELGGAT